MVPISAWPWLGAPLTCPFLFTSTKAKLQCSFNPLQREILVFIYGSLFAESPWSREEVSFPGEGRWIESISTQRDLGCFTKEIIQTDPNTSWSVSYCLHAIFTQSRIPSLQSISEVQLSSHIVGLLKSHSESQTEPLTMAVL